MTYCNVCKKRVQTDHQCYIQPKAMPKLKGAQKFVVYDFESMLRLDRSHQPNLCVAHIVCGKCMTENMNEECECDRRREVFRGEDTLDQFVCWLLRQKKVIALAHNGRAFDLHFIIDFLHRYGIKPSQIIQTGCKIMRLKVKDVLFLDTLNFLPMALAKLPKAFGLKELKKGFFPHLLNRADNQDYVGDCLPAREYYDPDSMSTENREAFNRWYDQHKDQPFDLQEELLQYCVSDVDILQRGAGAFRKIFVEATGIDPFVSATTIASACNVVYRTLFLKEDQIPTVPPKPTNQSSTALAWLEKKAKEDGVRIRHARNGGEVRVMGRLVDGMSPPNRIYDFLGCYFHSCPRCFKDREALHPQKRVPHGKVFEATMARVNQLRRAGYDVTTQWECLFKRAVSPQELKVLRQPFIAADPLQPREGFFGGRTEVFKLYHKVEGPEDSIRYEDVCSLYPWVCKYGRFPVGAPQILRGDDIPNNLLGLLHCKVLPPRQLFHPVLPARLGGKLLFALCRTCAESRCPESCPHEDPEDRAFVGTWISLELDLAVQKGYVILEKYEAWHYDQHEQYDPTTRQGGLWVEYIDTFLKMKAEASGYPSHAGTEEEKEAYVRDYLEHEGIQLDRTKIQHNPGLRSLAKLCLNSFCK